MFCPEATATTGAVTLPEGSETSEEPSCSTRHSGDSAEEVPTTSEPSACQSRETAVPSSCAAISVTLTTLRSPLGRCATTPR